MTSYEGERVYHLIIYAIIAAFISLVSAALLKDVQQRVARWLRQNGLENSALMNVIIFLDMVGAAIRVSVKVMTRSQRTEILMLDRTYPIHQIKDAQLRAALEQRGHAEQNVITLFSTA
jgi:hypothetical protein